MCTSRRRVLGFNAAARVCSGVTFLLRRFALDCGCLYVSIVAFCVWFTPVFFPFSGKKRRLAIGSVSIPPWVGIAGSAFSNVVRLSDFVGSLRVCAFICGDLDGLPGTRGTRERGYGAGGAALVRFCAGASALSCFPRGVRWGCAPQTCAKESSTLWTLFIGFAVKYVFVKPHNNCYPRTAASTPRNTRVYGKTRPALIYGRAGRAVLR